MSNLSNSVALSWSVGPNTVWGGNETQYQMSYKLDPWQITTNHQIHKKVKDDLKGDILSSESLNYQDWSCKFKGLKM